MGKKSIQTSSKNHDHKIKPKLNSLIKFLKPKVYITDSSNFKALVQELTGNESAVMGPPTMPPTWSSNSLEASFESYSSGFNSESSDLIPPFMQRVDDHHNFYDFEPTSLDEPEKFNDLSAQYMELESLLMMETDNNGCYYDIDDAYSSSCHGLMMMMNGGYQDHHHQVCAYGHDLSTLI